MSSHLSQALKYAQGPFWRERAGVSLRFENELEAAQKACQLFFRSDAADAAKADGAQLTRLREPNSLTH